MVNLNAKKYQNRLENMDFAGMLNFIRTSSLFPFRVQIGGFQVRSYAFTSQGNTPYERSFSIHENKAVLIGWPVRGEPLFNHAPGILGLVPESRTYPDTLDEIRRAFQNFHVLHSYHRTINDVDNDFYFRIGVFHHSSLSSVEQKETEKSIRHYLSEIKPLIIEIKISDIYVISYEDEQLPLDSTKVWSVSDPSVTPDFIQSLYEE